MKQLSLTALSALLALSVSAQTLCESGFAGDYPCHNVDLLAVMALEDIGGGANGNDCWGWTGPTGREYAIYGRANGTSFIEITDPTNPVYLGNLPTQTTNSLWRDIKVFNGHAFIVSEAGLHGMQVFDLMQLETVENPPVNFEVLAHYPVFGNAHNIAINEESGYAYAIGSSLAGGGLHIVDINDPANPQIAGLFGEDGYTHDTQVVMYNGPDADYQGKEIAFACNENTVTIVDVTDKGDCQFISSVAQDEQIGYIHQGWLTDDHRFFLMNDELDELNFAVNTRTYIINVEDLDNPSVVGFFESDLPASDHNLYNLGNLCYQANYFAGMRILNLDGIEEGQLEEVAYFDTNPEFDGAGFSGAWSVYPYFESGNVIISTFSHFFVVRPSETISGIASENLEETGFSMYPNPAHDQATLKSDNAPIALEDLRVSDLLGRRIEVEGIQLSPRSVRIVTADFTPGVYLVRVNGQGGTTRLIVER